MFGRKKTQTPVTTYVERPGAKNRPTPKRSQAEAARKRPLVPNDRKSATKASREEARQERFRMREAMLSGDERYLPVRDKGPVKRFVRDYVDARWNAGEFFLVVALVVVFLTLPGGNIAFIGTLVLWATVLLCLLDGYVLSRQLKKRLLAKFGEEGLQDHSVRYGVLRAFQIRRTRLPKPKVKRGEYPR